MKDILEINNFLTNHCKAFLHGEIKPAPAPGDVDYFIEAQFINEAVVFLKKHDFVVTNINMKFNHFVLRRFENGGKLYIIDLMSDLNIMLELIPYFILTKEGSKFIGTDSVAYAKLKSLVKKQAKFNEIIQTLPNLFEDKDFLKAGGSRTSNGVKTAGILHAKWFYFKIKIFRYFNKLYSGKRVAFIGPDGSGKTFIIGKLAEIGRTKSIYMGDWFFYFQDFYNQVKIRIPSPYNRFVYLFYPPEQYFRTLKTYVWKARGRIVLIDRFPGLNKNISKIGVLGKLNKFTFFMYPKPDIIFHLCAPSKVIYERKQELNVDEITSANLHLERKIGKKRVPISTVFLDDALNKILKSIYAD